ncbi:hypothetical protein SLEP1_g43381 [Rubroshorea leprosula]|uniref:ubiquitinyl hydrolase 1 n=1 Tax=Rubroshorea leprosula TaxID=152421 RepID=A0AAV5LCT7_9ROSI|nr:hypothetical protein SLEP1_g43381 [Rubroshorea leprosula]
MVDFNTWHKEVYFEPTVLCGEIDKISTFRASQLEDGDIICFQKSLRVESTEQFRYPDVPSFLEYVHNFQVVHFRSLEKPKEDDFCVEMSKLCKYDDVVENVAQQLGLDDPSKIRLTAHNCFSQQPKPQPIKYRGVDSLSDMLVCYNQASDILYYEVLDNPLPKLQCLKSLKVEFHHATKDEVIIHFIRLPKQSTVGDVLKDLKTKVELSHPNAELRLLEVFDHKIYKIFPPNEKIKNRKDQYWTLQAEEIPEEEKNLGPNDCLIHVYHFTKDTAQNQKQIQNFGEPFFLVIHEGETLAEIKLRIQKKLLVEDEEFAKWKFAFLSLGRGRPEYLQDCEILSSRFLKRNLFGAWEQHLGLKHPDNAHKRYYTANKERLKKEHEEKLLKKKKAEAQLSTIIKVARDEDLGEQIGRDIYFDLVDYDKVWSFHFEKRTPFNVFKEEAAKVFGIPVQFQRFWLLAKRENHTCRPKLPLTHLDETRPLGTLVEFSNKAQSAELKLFLEVELGLDLQPIAPPDKAKKDILLFFKHYNPEKKELRYVGRLFVKRTGKPTEILSRLNEMAGYSPDEEIDLFEEIKFEPIVMCEPIDKKITFGASQLEDGDIICFQKSLPVESTEKFRYPDVCSFLEYVHNRQVVHFRYLENPKEDDFCLEMSKADTYDNVVGKVAQQLGLKDPSKIRLTAHNCYSQQPKPQPIQYRGVDRLSDMLVHHNRSSSILYYEV